MIVGVLMTVCWLLGQRYGARQAMEVAAGYMSSAEAQSMIDDLQVALSAKDRELDALNSLAQVNSARAEALTDQLDVQMQQNLVDAHDLALYRKIEKTEISRSIDIETLKWDSSKPSFLEMTLIQWQGRERVDGEVQVSLEYDRAADFVPATGESANPNADPNGDPGANTVADTSSEADATRVFDDALIQMDLEPIPFTFRFFQTLAITLPSDFGGSEMQTGQFVVPNAIDVMVIPSDDRMQSVEVRFLWNDVAE